MTIFANIVARLGVGNAKNCDCPVECRFFSVTGQLHPRSQIRFVGTITVAAALLVAGDYLLVELPDGYWVDSLRTE
jgi:hypothetical protein